MIVARRRVVEMGPRRDARAGDARVPDLATERSYLSCALLDPDVLTRAEVRPEDLWSRPHAFVLEAMHALRARGSTISTETIRVELQRASRLERVGHAALLELTSAVPDVRAAEDLAEAIRREAALRRTAENALRASEAARRGDSDGAARALVVAREHAESADAHERPWLTDRWHPLRERAESAGWLREPPPPREWLLRRDDVPMLARGVVGLLVAPGGRGKTFALCDLAISIATGKQWLGAIDVAQGGRVVLALAEEDDAEVRRRLYEVARAKGLDERDRAAAEARIVALGLSGRNVSLVVVDDASVRPSDVHADVVRLVSAHRHEAVLLDPLARWAPGVEADNAIATQAIELLEAIAIASGGTVLVAHHTAKWARRDGDGAHGSSARGVTAITDGARWVAELRGGDDDDLALVVVKSNGAPLGEPIPLLRDSTTGVLRAMTAEEVASSEGAQRDSAGIDALVAELLAKLAERGAAGVVGQRALRELLPGRATRVREAIKRAQDRGLVVGGGKAPYVVATREAAPDRRSEPTSAGGDS